MELMDSFTARGINLEKFPMATDKHFDLDTITWVRSINNRSKVPRKELLEVYVSDTGYFGNEASIGTVYSQCALVIEFPYSNSKAKLEIAERLVSQPVAEDAVTAIPMGKRMK
jgi:hypothetical protein